MTTGDATDTAMTAAVIHRRLYAQYGPQGWWPLLAHGGTNPTKTGAMTGYHPGDYSFPRNDAERFEIGVGAILTQNTAWPNVERALHNLATAGRLGAEELAAAPIEDIAELIRPSGYFNVKARKLKTFVDFLRRLGNRVPSRNDLLAVWGIGEETADSIRLYAYGQPEMVVDAYTRRILAHLGLATPKASYATLKAYCRQGLPADVPMLQEFHALVVEHAKRHYRRQPYHDPLLLRNEHLQERLTDSGDAAATVSGGGGSRSLPAGDGLQAAVLRPLV